jgi:hypothetical protein
MRRVLPAFLLRAHWRSGNPKRDRCQDGDGGFLSIHW